MAFDSGCVAYTASGVRVEVLSASSGGGYIVMRLNSSGEKFGQPKIIRSLFSEPPVEQYTEQVQAARRELEKLRAEISEANREREAMESQKGKLIAKLTEQVQVLSGIADWIDGKVTHVVVVSDYGEVSVRKIEELACESSRNAWRKEIKLMTLFGDSPSGGSLTWKVNKYYDGSGSWDTVYLCQSEEEAKAKATQVIREWEVPDSQGYTAKRLIDSAEELGFAPPERLLRVASAYRLKECQREIASINERRAKVAADYPELFTSGLVTV